MFNAKQYLDNVAVSPKDAWKNINQETINTQWEDTTQTYIIKEQVALPFSDEYIEQEVWLDTVSDTLVNTSKSYSDFVKILFKDCDHKQNYRGQYYKIAIDNDKEEYYICYDRINRLKQVATTQVVRCNNVLTWRDEYGNIVTMPCYLGSDISSTNNLVSKDSIIPNSRIIILIQANDYTMSIRKNQRFMFQHSNCFKVEEVNQYMQEQGTDNLVTFVKIYVDYSTLLPSDNVELNICDYYENDYTLNIVQDSISQISGFKGKLDAVVTDNKGNVVDMPLKWVTSDLEVVEVDTQGNYYLVGKSGSMAKITCSMVYNEAIKDSVDINIVEDFLPDKKIVVSPLEVDTLQKGEPQEFSCAVYIEGEKQQDKVNCEVIGVSNKDYELTETIDGYKIELLKTISGTLTLRFYAQGCDDVTIDMILEGKI